MQVIRRLDAGKQKVKPERLAKLLVEFLFRGADRDVVHQLTGIICQQLKLLEVGVCTKAREGQKRRCVTSAIAA